MKDFYYILGTDVNSTFSEVKEAYQKLYVKFHPDLNENDQYFENQFKEIYEAYQVLSNPERRSLYDQELKKAKVNTTTRSLSKPGYSSKTKTIDITFTIIFGISALVFASYVIQSLTGSKRAKLKQAPVVTAFSPPKIMHHKKKHGFKLRAISTTNKVSQKDTVKAVSMLAPHVAVSAVIAENSSKPGNNKSAIEINSENRPDIVKSSTGSPAILYSTNIKANETGIINLRKYDKYNSEIVKVIPGNSKVFVLEKGAVYYKVIFENATGYVPRWTLQIK